jgi:hypothetical protein
MRYYFATVLKAWDSARPVGNHRKITPIFGVRGRGVRPHMADAVIEDLLQLLTAGFGPTWICWLPARTAAYWGEPVALVCSRQGRM